MHTEYRVYYVEEKKLIDRWGVITMPDPFAIKPCGQNQDMVPAFPFPHRSQFKEQPQYQVIRSQDCPALEIQRIFVNFSNFTSASGLPIKVSQ